MKVAILVTSFLRMSVDNWKINPCLICYVISSLEFLQYVFTSSGNLSIDQEFIYL